MTVKRTQHYWNDKSEDLFNFSNTENSSVLYYAAVSVNTPVSVNTIGVV